MRASTRTHARQVWGLALALCLLLSACGIQTPPPTGTQAPATAPAPTATQAPPETTQAPPETTQAPPETTQPDFDSYAMACELSTEEKVGQLFLARCPDRGALEDIQAYHLGGYVLFGRDFKDGTPESVSAALAGYQAVSAIPLLLAVDEEGGTVTRVSGFPQYRSSKFPSPRELYAQGGLALIASTEAEKCALLRSLGLNVNLAPVCDITTDRKAFMYQRSLGQSPEITGDYISAVVQVQAAHQVGGVLKHFPGYGNNADTHTGIATDERSLAELEAVDLKPFAAGIQVGCGAIMVSHTFINAMDKDYPASLSPAVHGYIRQSMGFQGVLVTDDLAMGAITDLYGDGEAAVLAVLAGNDLLCSSAYQTQYAAVLDAVNSGRISQEQLNRSVARILQWKHDLGLL